MKFVKRSALVTSAALMALAGMTMIAPPQVQIFAAPAPAAKAAAGDKVPENLALEKQVTVSSYQNDGLKGNLAVDGDDGTRWCAENGSVPQWIQVDLATPQDLTGCQITWEADAASYSFKIAGSADGKSWSPLAENAYKNTGKSRTQAHLFSAKGVRYVRLTVDGTTPGAWASVSELEVFGTQMIAGDTQKKKAAAAKAKNEAPPTPAAVKAPQGWDVSIFAAPPEVNYPTTVAATIDGNVFVGIDEQGSLGKAKGRGRVVRLRDTNNDGKADQITDFAKMDNPRGVWADGKDLYVLHPPFLTKYTDDNGDGIADKEELLVKGIANDKIQNDRGADHTTNGFRVGVDGWIYIAMGDFGTPKATGKDGKELQMWGGGVVRVRLDGSGLEDYSFGQRNIYDVAIDPYMNVFTRDNTNDGGGWNVRLSHVIPSGNYGYPRLFIRFGEEIVQPLNDFGGGSPCGALWVDEPGIPDIASGLLTVEWGASKIWKHPLTAKGAGYEPSKQESFLSLSRPTDIDYDGHGNFFVASWSNGSFSYSGPNVGYLARVTPTDFKGVATPDIAKSTDADLHTLLASPSMKLREAAQREILRRGDKPGVIEGLQKLASGKGLPQGRAAAIFTLPQLAGAKANDFLAKLTSDADVREIALRALADRVGPASTDAQVQPFLAGLKDTNPRVRLMAAWGLGRVGRMQDAAALIPLAGDADPLVQHVAINSLVALKAADAALAAIDSSNVPLTTGLLRTLQRIHDAKVVDGLAQKLQSATDNNLKSALYRSLARLYFKEAEYTGTWWGTRPDTSGPYYKTAEWDGTPKVKALLEAALKNENPDVVRQLVVDMQLHKIESPVVEAYVADKAKTDPKFRQMLIDQLSQGDTALNASQRTLLKSVAQDSKVEADQRAKSIRVLGKVTKDGDALLAVMESLATIAGEANAPAELTALLDETLRDAKYGQQIPFFTKLTASDKPAVRELAYGVLVSVANSKLTKPEQKKEAATAVEKAWAKPEPTASLLRAIGRTKTVEYRQAVQAHATDANPEVASAAKYAAERLGLTGGAMASAGQTIEQVGYDKTLAFAVKEKGDAKIGQEIFARVGCVGCHTVAPNEPPKGPYLGGISERYKRDELVESIAKPNAKISQGFETQWFKLKGQEDDPVEGFVTREGGQDLELRNAAGVAQIIKIGDIVKRGKRETSIMPEGLVQALTPKELADLLAYLETLKK